MNRREHYQRAEALLRASDPRSAEDAGLIAAAQVHATLATVPARWIAGESYDDQIAASAAEEEDSDGHG